MSTTTRPPGDRARRAVAGLLAVLPLALPPVSADAPAALATAIVTPALVAIEVRWHGWVRDGRTGEIFGGPAGYRAVTRCSGFVINPDGHLVTAAHCVDPGAEGAGRLLLGQVAQDLIRVGRARDVASAVRSLGQHAVIEGSTAGSPPDRQVSVRLTAPSEPTPATTRPGLLTGQTLKAAVIDVVPRGVGDVALLKVEGGRLPTLALTADPENGADLFVGGYPASGEPLLLAARATARRPMGGVTFFEISPNPPAGLSGGPVVDPDGRVVGLVSAPPTGDDPAAGLITIGSRIRDLLGHNGVHNELSPLDRNYRTGLIRYFQGRYTAAIAYLDAVLDVAPDLWQAREYRLLAVRARDRTGDRPSTHLLVARWLGAAGLLCAGAATVIWLLRRHTTARIRAGEIHATLTGPADTP